MPQYPLICTSVRTRDQVQGPATVTARVISCPETSVRAVLDKQLSRCSTVPGQLGPAEPAQSRDRQAQATLAVQTSDHPPPPPSPPSSNAIPTPPTLSTIFSKTSNSFLASKSHEDFCNRQWTERKLGFFDILLDIYISQLSNQDHRVKSPVMNSSLV